MPDVTQAELGRRLYHVHRGKTVEVSMKMMQQGIGAEWRSFSEADITLLTHLLQCTWNKIDQKVWDKIPFVNIKMDEVRQILSRGTGIRPGRNPSPETVEEIKKILLAIR
ncbi:MAG: hypothetical protein M0R30_14470 [Methanoregula sp.]|jgi:hypothetical protein|uniref:hypothetical protein n=1 Tax=Methanoregula sp. TaxID=2052170 RepID=UPI0025EEE1F6|nr:hypothetical protein [Methanoregula sp.]MCK9632831.1 hypothetical protein [Methanoregula sp.]